LGPNGRKVAGDGGFAHPALLVEHDAPHEKTPTEQDGLLSPQPVRK
jgi:hypothetical protein